MKKKTAQLEINCEKGHFKCLACHHLRAIPAKLPSTLLGCLGHETVSFDAANPYLNLSHTFHLTQEASHSVLLY